MSNSTTDVYAMKREAVNFSKGLVSEKIELNLSL